jgi:hypothetical protein
VSVSLYTCLYLHKNMTYNEKDDQRNISSISIRFLAIDTMVSRICRINQQKQVSSVGKNKIIFCH